MISQLSLFDVRPSFSRSLILQSKQDMTPQEARDEGIKAVEDHADPAWLQSAWKAIRSVCESQRYFSTNDIWPRILGAKTRDNRALGALMKTAKEKKWCRKTGRHLICSRTERHAGEVAEWESILYPNPS